MTSSKRREKKRGETLFLQSRGIEKGQNHFQLGTRPVNLLLLAQWWHCVCVCLLLLLKKLRNKQLRKRQPVVKGCNKNNKKRVGEIQYKQIGSDWVDCLHSAVHLWWSRENVGPSLVPVVVTAVLYYWPYYFSNLNRLCFMSCWPFDLLFSFLANHRTKEHILFPLAPLRLRVLGQ